MSSTRQAIQKHNKQGVAAKRHKKTRHQNIALKNQSVFVRQDFKVIDDRILDSKGRITLSHSWIAKPVRSFKIYRNGDGDLLLRPEVSIPAREAWIFQNPEIHKGLQKAIKEAEAGKGEIVDDLDAYLENL